MIARTIHDSPRFSLTSWGNGTAYELVNKEAKRSLYFQDDDMLEFQSEYEALTNGAPALDYADALQCIWNDYEHVSRECTQ